MRWLGEVLLGSEQYQTLTQETIFSKEPDLIRFLYRPIYALRYCWKQ